MKSAEAQKVKLFCFVNFVLSGDYKSESEECSHISCNTIFSGTFNSIFSNTSYFSYFLPVNLINFKVDICLVLPIPVKLGLGLWVLFEFCLKI